MSKSCQCGRDRARGRAENKEGSPTEGQEDPLVRPRRLELIPPASGDKGARDESDLRRGQEPTESVGPVAVEGRSDDLMSGRVWQSEHQLCSGAFAKVCDP